MATKYPEYPKMYPDVNAGQMHLLLHILIDLSGSMVVSMEKLRAALELLVATLKANPRANATVEVAIITFNSTVQYTPHMPLPYYEGPTITASGCTSLHEALETTIKIDRERKTYLRSKGTGTHRSWVYVLSDGLPTDSDNGRIEQLHQAQRRGSMVVYPVHIWDENSTDVRLKEEAEKFLAGLSIDGSLITATRGNFENTMVWLTDSLVKVSETNTGDTVMLPNPCEDKYGGIEFKQIPARECK